MRGSDRFGVAIILTRSKAQAPTRSPRDRAGSRRIVFASCERSVEVRQRVWRCSWGRRPRRYARADARAPRACERPPSEPWPGLVCCSCWRRVARIVSGHCLVSLCALHRPRRPVQKLAPAFRACREPGFVNSPLYDFWLRRRDGSRSRADELGRRGGREVAVASRQRAP